MVARFGLFVVWFVGLAVSVGTILYAFRAAPVDSTVALKEHLGTVVGIFVPYLGPIIAFWYARDVIGRAAPKSATTFYIAFICSIAFNAALVWQVGTILFVQPLEMAVVSAKLDLARTLATVLAFLVGPTIGFYFGKLES